MALAAAEAEALLVLAQTLARLDELRPLPEGLFRVPAVLTEVEELAASLVRGGDEASAALRGCLDAYTCADALKKWLRQQRLLPCRGAVRERLEHAAEAAALAAQQQHAVAARAAAAEAHQAVGELAAPEQALLGALLPFLRGVVGMPETGMTAYTLAICLGPTLFDGCRDPGAAQDLAALQTNATEVRVLQLLLEHDSSAGEGIPPPAASAADEEVPLVLGDVIRGGPALLRELLRCGRIPDVNDAPEDRWTLLHWAARLGAHHCALLLLDRGADVSAADWSGYTPLHVAANPEVAEVLMWGGGASQALVTLNREGKAPGEEHREEGRCAVAAVFERAPARLAEARRQRLCWAMAGVHRRLAHSEPSDQPSAPFRFLSDDLVAEVGRRIPTIAPPTAEDALAIREASGSANGGRRRELPMPQCVPSRRICAVQ